MATFSPLFIAAVSATAYGWEAEQGLIYFQSAFHRGSECNFGYT